MQQPHRQGGISEAIDRWFDSFFDQKNGVVHVSVSFSVCSGPNQTLDCSRAQNEITETTVCAVDSRGGLNCSQNMLVLCAGVTNEVTARGPKVMGSIPGCKEHVRLVCLAQSSLVKF